MPQAVWTGSISFGLVSIPVRLHPATSPRDVRFRQIDRRTGHRVRYRRVVEEAPPEREPEPAEAPSAREQEPAEAPRREAEGPPETSDAPLREAVAAPEPAPPLRRAERDVGYDDIVKGYEVDKGRHVILEPEEVEALRPEPSRTIDIEHFVPLEHIDPVYFEKSYHLSPGDDAAVKPYSLLRLAMERAGRVAIGRFVLRTREHLVAIRPTGGILGLETLFYSDEVRTPAWQLASTDDVTGGEAEMAGRLIQMLAAEWDPAMYEDTYRQRILELIGEREPTATPEPEEGRAPAVTDLMAALKASVDALAETDKARRRKGRKGRQAGGH